MKTGIELITEERKRQIVEEKWDASHDEQHSAFQLSAAAGCYIANVLNKDFKDHTHYDDMGDCAKFIVRDIESRKWNDAWPWENWDKRDKHDVKRSLVIAGALIAAEIDRLQNGALIEP